MNLAKLINFQEELAKKIKLTCNFDLTVVRFVAGVDVSYSRKAEICCCCASLFDVKRMKIVERAFLFRSTRDMFPYIPGFFLFREGDIMIRAINLLKGRMDVVLVDGNGILHPRKAGIACYVGIELGKPTVGIAKSLLCGRIVSGKVMVNDEPRGSVILAGKRRFYVSPAHLIGLEEATKVVELCMHDDVVVPLEDADKKSREMIRKLTEK